MSDAAHLASDPRSLFRSRQYWVLLLLAAAIGLLVSTAAWLFLEAVHEIEVSVCQDFRTTSAMTGCRCGGRFRGWRWLDC